MFHPIQNRSIFDIFNRNVLFLVCSEGDSRAACAFGRRSGSVERANLTAGGNPGLSAGLEGSSSPLSFFGRHDSSLLGSLPCHGPTEECTLIVSLDDEWTFWTTKTWHVALHVGLFDVCETLGENLNSAFQFAGRRSRQRENAMVEGSVLRAPNEAENVRKQRIFHAQQVTWAHQEMGIHRKK